MVRCRDKAHRPQFYSNWEEKWWCIYAKDFSKTELGARYPDGRSVNLLRLCEKTGKVVVHNKKCDCIEEYESRLSDNGKKTKDVS